MSRNIGAESGLNAAGTAMRYKNLGESGLLVSELSFGCMMFQDESAEGIAHAYDMLKCAYRNGCNFFDNAEGYEGGAAERVEAAVAVACGQEGPAALELREGDPVAVRAAEAALVHEAGAVVQA